MWFLVVYHHYLCLSSFRKKKMISVLTQGPMAEFIQNNLYKLFFNRLLIGHLDGIYLMQCTIHHVITGTVNLVTSLTWKHKKLAATRLHPHLLLASIATIYNLELTDMHQLLNPFMVFNDSLCPMLHHVSHRRWWRQTLPDMNLLHIFLTCFTVYRLITLLLTFT